MCLKKEKKLPLLIIVVLWWIPLALLHLLLSQSLGMFSIFFNVFIYIFYLSNFLYFTCNILNIYYLNKYKIFDCFLLYNDIIKKFIKYYFKLYIISKKNITINII